MKLLKWIALTLIFAGFGLICLWGLLLWMFGIHGEL